MASIDEQMPLKWHNKDDVGEVPQGQGIQRKMSLELRERIVKFGIVNSNNMQKSIQRYEEAKSERSREWKRFKAFQSGKPFSPLPTNI